MSCQTYTLQAIDLNECNDNYGGVERVWVADRDNWTKVAPTVSGDTELIIDDANSGMTFYEIKFDRDVTTYTESASFTAGVAPSVTAELSIEILKMSAEHRTAVQALLFNNNLIAIVKDNNSAYHFMGYDFPVKVTSLNGQTGAVMLSDKNSYTIVLQDVSKRLTNQLAPASKVITDNLEA